MKIRNSRYSNFNASELADYSKRVFGVPIPPNYYIYVPCGRCLDCLKKRLSGYRMRLLYELQRYPNSIFLTLTFDNPNLSKFRDNPNKALSLFFDRLRKSLGQHFRHFFIAEYGEKKGRLHYHGILFNCSLTNEVIQKTWKYGITYVGYANEITAKYIVKYLTKDNTKGESPPRVISSKGIGDLFFSSPESKFCKANLQTYIKNGSYISSLPRYYIDKLFSQREKEMISYYSYMENDRVYYVGGNKYYDEELANKARIYLYEQYKSNGYIFDKHPRITIPSFVKSQVHFESYLQNYLEKNFYYGRVPNSFEF